MSMEWERKTYPHGLLHYTSGNYRITKLDSRYPWRRYGLTKKGEGKYRYFSRLRDAKEAAKEAA